MATIFTLPEDLRRQLSQLRDDTDIVVYLRHTGADQDSYDAAAEQRIVEQVKDLVEQFQNLGPRFRVQVLDKARRGLREDHSPDRRRQERKLAQAILDATENSIFVYAKTTTKADDKEKKDRVVENVQQLVLPRRVPARSGCVQEGEPGQR